MEENLDQLIGSRACGELFPQFGERWTSTYGMARNVRDSLAGGKLGRCRIALEASDPLSFCSLFLAFCGEACDLFFLDPSWGRRERQRALSIAGPSAVIGNFGEGEFAQQRMLANESELSAAFDETRFMIPTGGTSGQIRFAIHNWHTLSAAVGGMRDHFEVDSISSFCTLPLHHVSGFMQLLRALLTSGKVAFGVPEDLAVGREFFERKAAVFVSLVPTQLSRLMQRPGLEQWRSGYTTILLGGGPTSVDLLDRARELRLPLAPTYGMTETAAQVATLTPEEFLAGESGVGRPLPHATIEIADAAGSPVGCGKDGDIRIDASSLFLGYFGGPPRDDSTFTAFDFGRMDARGYLEVLGRSDGTIVSGGEKLSLREIEIAIEATALVKDVAAFGIDDAEWGSKLAVAFVPENEAATTSALEAALRSELARYKRPKLWLSLEAIPRNATGKVNRSELLRLARNTL